MQRAVQQHGVLDGDRPSDEQRRLGSGGSSASDTVLVSRAARTLSSPAESDEMEEIEVRR